ncbi:alpha/beta fold hydrolase [Serinicoccus kebangsaanensis]|uniref:alpha/beta fold hydrolase n=1 Tax=Serinicoccus kebangsaanensis TaxID=2602069 RepID=UPI00124C0D33|nr:alpha/beta hydrolase [Serinicoccus kebangsaanensis]
MTVIGERGPAVVLLPGGAAGADGFFPGMPEALVEDPGCRVVLHDRPGTGASTDPGGLAGASAHLHRLVADLDLGPVVAVGQSLGGAVATLWARDHPEDLSGLVLLDATPVNDPALAAYIELQSRVLGALTRVPGLGGRLEAGFVALARRQASTAADPALAAAMEQAVDGGLVKLGRATVGLGALARELREEDLPRLPAAVVTADRPERSRIRRAHQRLATAFGAELISWPGATHGVHLDHADEVLGVVRGVVRRAAGQPGT